MSVAMCNELLAFSVEDYLIDVYKTNPNSGRKTVFMPDYIKIPAAKYCDNIIKLRHRANDYDHIVNYENLLANDTIMSILL